MAAGLRPTAWIIHLMDIGRSAFEMARPIEVRDEPGLARRPPQQFPGPRARGRPAQTEEVANKTKMAGCLLVGLGYHRDAEAPADDIGDFPRRHTLVGDGTGRLGTVDGDGAKRIAIRPTPSRSRPCRG